MAGLMPSGWLDVLMLAGLFLVAFLGTAALAGAWWRVFRWMVGKE